MRKITSHCPWLIEDADLNPVGDPELERHLVGEKQIGLVVKGQYGAILGYIVMRCERDRGEWVVTHSLIPNDPVIAAATDMDPAQSNPRRELHGYGYSE